MRNNELRNLIRSIEQLSEQVQGVWPRPQILLIADAPAESETKVDELNVEIATVTQQLEETQNEQLENTRAIMRVQKNAERYLIKRQTLINRKDECNIAIRDLGVLPEEAFSKYTDLRPDKVSHHCCQLMHDPYRL